jgi:hypothetical protein
MVITDLEDVRVAGDVLWHMVLREVLVQPPLQRAQFAVVILRDLRRELLQHVLLNATQQKRQHLNQVSSIF